jgi:elongation factor G
VLDGGVVVFDATQGVEPQSETVWRQADRYSVPRICFINKMDRVGRPMSIRLTPFASAWEPIRLRCSSRSAAKASFAGVVDLLTMQAISGR